LTIGLFTWEISFMSTIYVSTIFNRVARVTGDPAFVEPTRAQLLDWFNEGETALVKRKPDAYVKTANQVLTEGTKQALAEDGIIFLEPNCNMGTDGSTPGRVVYTVTRERINRTSPNWHSVNADAQINAVIFDERNPKVFYVSPPQPAVNQGYLDYDYSALPPTIIVTDENYDVAFTVGDEYAPEMLNYLLFRIYSEDTGQISDAVARAQMYWGLFTGDIIDKEAIENRDSPNVPRR